MMSLLKVSRVYLWIIAEEVSYLLLLHLLRIRHNKFQLIFVIAHKTRSVIIQIYNPLLLALFLGPCWNLRAITAKSWLSQSFLDVELINEIGVCTTLALLDHHVFKTSTPSECHHWCRMLCLQILLDYIGGLHSLLQRALPHQIINQILWNIFSVNIRFLALTWLQETVFDDFTSSMRLQGFKIQLFYGQFICLFILATDLIFLL